ncbi:MAG: hypothetical protein K2N13_06210 [Paraprevotella sp.]|nr:hypothetical protein [Paraprevotella sp.]
MFSLWGQTDADAQKKEINKVKKSNQYLYGEATMATQEEAMLLAEELLYSNINQWVAEQKKLNAANKVVVVNTKQLWGNIALPRGNMFRAFYYVKKSDILPAENTNIIEKERAGNGGTSVEPLSAEEVVAGDTQSEKTVTEEVGTEEKTTTDVTIPPVVREVAEVTDFSRLQSVLNRLKSEGKVKDFNKYAVLTNKDDYYLIIYNKEGKIEAVLSKGPSRLNVKTGQTDGVENYSGRGAIGFSIVE